MPSIQNVLDMEDKAILINSHHHLLKLDLINIRGRRKRGSILNCQTLRIQVSTALTLETRTRAQSPYPLWSRKEETIRIEGNSSRKPNPKSTMWMLNWVVTSLGIRIIKESEIISWRSQQMKILLMAKLSLKFPRKGTGRRQGQGLRLVSIRVCLIMKRVQKKVSLTI